MKRIIGFAILLTVAVVVLAQSGDRNYPTAEPLNPSQSRLVHVTNFPDLQNVSGTVHVENLPAVQEVVGSVDVQNLPQVQEVTGTVQVGNLPSISVTAFHLVGYTSATVTGNVGLFALTEACQLEYPGSRICTLSEIKSTTNLPDLTSGASSAWVETGGNKAGTGAADGNCLGWSVANASTNGMAITTLGAYRPQSCEAGRGVACCAPGS